MSLRALLLVLVLLVSTMGCSGLAGVTDSSAEGSEVDRLAAADDGARRSLRLGMVKPVSLRPDEVVLSDQAGVIVSDLLYDGLTEVDGASNALRPALAVGWEPSADYRRWTFELDEGAGLDAETVASSLRRLVWPLAPGQSQGRVVAALTAGMRSVSAPDGLTVVVELHEPNAGFPWIMSGLPYSIVDAGGLPTGRFEVATRRPTGMVLARRPDASSGGDVRADVVELTWAESPAEAYRLLLDQVVDGAVVDPGSVGDAQDRFGLSPTPTTAVRYVVLAADSQVLSDAGRRAELVASVDRQRLLGGLAGGAALPVDGLLSPTTAGYREGACGVVCGWWELGLAEGSGGDVGRAQQSLAVVHAGGEHGELVDDLVAELSVSGWSVAVSEVSPRGFAEAIVDGSADLFAFGWVPPAGSADAVLPPLLLASSPANVARIGTTEIEALLAEAARTADDETRWGLLDGAHRAAMGEGRILPVGVSISSLVVDPEVGSVIMRSDGSIDLETVN